jgi:hypothetical protein
MRTASLIAGIVAGAMIWSAGIHTASAQLPSLSKQPWLGHFTGLKTKKYTLGVTSVGKITLTPIGAKGDEVSHALAIPIEIGIEETFPDGKTTLRQIKPDTLSSPDPAKPELEKTMIKGQVTGDASFELYLEQVRGITQIGGRITDPGTLTKNPIRFAMRVKFPSAYSRVKTDDKKSKKALEEKLEEDRIDIKWIDGKRVKQTFEKPVEAASKEFNGPGIVGAEIEVSVYQGKKILLMASENSSMSLWNAALKPLHEGFSVNWTPDVEKDKEGKARLSIDVR